MHSITDATNGYEVYGHDYENWVNILCPQNPSLSPSAVFPKERMLFLDSVYESTEMK